jgi:SAM-dependent methyltransferase
MREFLKPHTIYLKSVERCADVGCGSGEITYLLPKMFANIGLVNVKIVGFDIHPGISQMIENNNVRFVKGDPIKSNESFDIIFLIDVIEHIVAPVDFLTQFSAKTQWLVLHIPLDESSLSMTRNLPLENITNPGHVSIFDAASALNMVTNSGFRLLDYRYTPIFKAPTGRNTAFQKLMFPFRMVLYKISPYLTSKTIGGASLLVLAKSPYFA